ncbi:hypothetical protein ACQ4PT_056928 [Festuca glaucescens]
MAQLRWKPPFAAAPATDAKQDEDEEAPARRHRAPLSLAGLLVSIFLVALSHSCLCSCVLREEEQVERPPAWPHPPPPPSTAPHARLFPPYARATASPPDPPRWIHIHPTLARASLLSSPSPRLSPAAPGFGGSNDGLEQGAAASTPPASVRSRTSARHRVQDLIAFLNSF